MSRSERDVQSSILKYLRKLKNQGHPLFFERRQAGGFSYKKGLPDIYFVYKGIHIEVEVKASDGKLSTDQETWQTIFKELEIEHLVIDDFSEFKEYMTNLIKLSKED